MANTRQRYFINYRADYSQRVKNLQAEVAQAKTSSEPMQCLRAVRENQTNYYHRDGYIEAECNRWMLQVRRVYVADQYQPGIVGVRARAAKRLLVLAATFENERLTRSSVRKKVEAYCDQLIHVDSFEM